MSVKVRLQCVMYQDKGVPVLNCPHDMRKSVGSGEVDPESLILYTR